MSAVSAGRVMILPKGSYDAATTYHLLDAVYYGGSTYICKQTTVGNLPTNTTYWQLMAQGTSATVSGNYYGECTTAAAAAAKEVDVPASENFVLQVGDIVGVKFTYTNTASTPTINVNSSGAKRIYYNNAEVGSDTLWAGGEAGRITLFMYDGTDWIWIAHDVDNDTNTADGISYDNTTSGLTADDVQEALDELASSMNHDTSINVIRETSPASAAHSVGDYIYYNDTVYSVTAAIARYDLLVVDTNIEVPTLDEGTVIYIYGEEKSWRFDKITDEEFADLVALADSGKLDLYDDCGWRVGQKRSVSLSAIAASGTYDGVSWSVGEAQPAQTAEFVLMHKGLYELVTPVLDTEGNARNTVSFVVGIKNNLEVDEYMNSTNTNTNSWDGSALRAFCNGGFRSALPSTIRSAFKQIKTITAQTYDGTTNQTSEDYFALFAEKEIFGVASNSNTTEASALTQIDYFKSAINRIKTKLGSKAPWWTRSPFYGLATQFGTVTTGGVTGSTNASNTRGVSPFGGI